MSSSSRTLQHVGEWKVELRADAIGELFMELARVVAGAAGPARVPRDRGAWEHVVVDGRDSASLLVDWANELIGRGEVEGRAFAAVRDLSIRAGRPDGMDGTDSALRLEADVSGDVVEEWVSPLKAATYHGATVTQEGREWRAEVLFDV